MTAMSTVRAPRWGAAALAFASVAGAAVIGAAPAQAASVNMTCKILSSSIPWNGSVQGVVSPTKPKAGGNATVTITFPSGYMTGPVPVPAGKLQPVLTLSINGTTVTARGGTNATALPPDKSFTVPTTKVQFKAKSGSNKITLTKVVFDYLPGEPDTTCTNKGGAPTVVSFTAASSTTASPTPTASQTTEPVASESPTAEATTGTDNNGGKKNNLAKTGPEDSTRTLLIAVVAIQLGLVAWFRWGRRPAYADTRRGAHR